MNQSEFSQQYQQSSSEERGAAIGSNNKTMKVQDRIHATNNALDQEELLEPLEMMTVGNDFSGKSPSSSNYPKRSSVIDMWKKREGAIKRTSSYTTKYEEKKEVHSSENDPDLPPLEFEDSEPDVRQQDKMSIGAISSGPLGSSSTRLVTPERSGPDSEENGSNGGSSVRRSNVRQFWKKKAPPVSSYISPAKTEPLSVNTSAESCSPVSERESLTVGMDPSPMDNDTGSHAISVSPSPRGAVRNTWRKPEETKPQPAPSTPRSKFAIDRSQSRDSGVSDNPSNGRSTPSAFDELRSKWAKFGVTQHEAGTAGRVKPAAPITSSIAATTTFSPKVSFPRASHPEFTTTEDKGATPINRNFGHPRVDVEELNESASPPPSPRTAENHHSPTGGRKNHFVKMGQMHAARPKADAPPKAQGPIKRFTPSQYKASNAVSQKELKGKIAVVSRSDLPIKRNALQKSAELRAKHRRRAQQAQSLSAAAAPSVAHASSYSHSEKAQDETEDSFPLDEMGPDTFHARFRNEDDTMVRSTLPMRTLFGSQSGESLQLGPSNEGVRPHFQDPRMMTKTDVMKTTFDSWSDIDSFSTEGPTNDSEVVKPRPPGSHLTNSALRRLREKRQKGNPREQEGSDRYQVPMMDEPATPQPYFSDHRSHRMPSSTRGYHDPSSPDASSSAVSHSQGSDTSFSNSQMQSTIASGFTKETPKPTVAKSSNLHSKLKDVVPNFNEMIPDEFVSEKNASVQSFRNAYENMSLEQIAKDMKDEASSILSIDFLNRDLLNKSVNAAGASLNKLVAGDMFSVQHQRRLIKRATSPVEEVAIEVEYIADSEYDP